MDSGCLDEGYRRSVEEALARLGVCNLVLGIHDAALPATGVLDGGRGSPCSREGDRFFRFARDLGFTGIQLGPQGLTAEHSASPYEGAQFSREILSVDLDELADRGGLWAGILDADALGTPEPGRLDHSTAHFRRREALRNAFAGFRRLSCRRSPGRELLREFAIFRRRHASWLVPDALYEVLRREHGASDRSLWRERPTAALDRNLWPRARDGRDPAALARRDSLRRDHRDEIDFYAFCQFVAHRQHERFLRRAEEIGLRLFGDLQIGFSDRDSWRFHDLFLPGYRLGAPPSRTNPEGQPWGYPALDPDAYFESGDPGRPGPVQRWLARRVDKLLSEYHGLRIDHPQGLVCPWVYREGTGDPAEAVRRGARLFSSPDLEDHPELARYAIPERSQINPQGATPRHADDWVAEITEAQRKRYSVLFDVVLEAARSNGRGIEDLIPEILSSCPHPLARVLRHHGLGRFRVTQKADPRRAEDLYRSENAAPEDWIMIGNHDTPPILAVVEAWERAGELEARAAYLASRLEPEPSSRSRLATRLAGDPRLVAQAQLADLFLGPARNVMIFFTDLFGFRKAFNRPGVVSPENWSLRLPGSFAVDYRGRVARGEALDVPAALASALEARPDLAGSATDELIARLAAASQRFVGGGE